MRDDAKIFVAGHRGLAGSAIVRRLRAAGYERLVLRTRAELDLRDAAATRAFFEAERPEYVVLAAAKVGGIVANATMPADFIRDNLLIATSVIDAAHRAGVRRFVNLGSSCIYPKHAPQPMREEHLLTGPLEPTNEAYAIAKIAALEMCQAYHRQHGFEAISLMPTNLYGPGDNFDLHTSHVLPALLRKFDEAKRAGAKSVTVWGTGAPRREFLHVDDLADAVLFVLRHELPAIDRVAPDRLLNVGVGKDITIRELAETVRKVTGAEVEVELDTSKPDGTPRKLLDVSRLEGLGWRARIGLEEGLASTYRWYCERSAPPT